MKKLLIGLLTFCSLSISAHANNTTESVSESQPNKSFVWGTYGQDAAQIPGSRVANNTPINTPVLVKFINDNHIQTFNFIIRDSAVNGKRIQGLEYTNFVNFLEATKDSKIKVWITLVPPSEIEPGWTGSFAAQTGLLGDDEVDLVDAIKADAKDYKTWFKLCSLVASKYPNFVGVNIDDFINNVDDDFWYSNKFFTAQMLQQMKSNLRFYNTSNLSFIATTYIGRTVGEVYTITKKDSTWLKAIDVMLLYDEKYLEPTTTFKMKASNVREQIAAVTDVSVAQKLSIVAGIYIWGASWYQYATPSKDYVRETMEYAKSSLDGAMIYRTTPPTSDYGSVVYPFFEEWDRSQ